MSIWSRLFAQETKASLNPGKCECGHLRCNHDKGKGDCQVSTSKGMVCACMIFIPQAIDPVLDELERIAKLK